MAPPCRLVISACLLGSLAAGCRPSAPAPTPQPSTPPLRTAPSRIVLIVVDALRADHLPVYGYPKPTAPFVSRLAARGVVFERALAASTWTAPSMASIFTGLYPSQHGVRMGYATTREALLKGRTPGLNRIPRSLETLPETLRRLGYKTYGLADNLNICEKMGFADGFDQFASFRYKSADALHAKLEEWQPDWAAQTKAFLYLHYMDTHRPYKPRERWLDASEPDARMAAYDSNIGFLDTKIEQLFQVLRLEEDALVVITADHGEEFGDHGDVGHGPQLYQELVRVPLIVSAPARFSPRRVADAVSTVDLLPSLRALLGDTAVTEGEQGKSFTALLEGRALPARAFFPMRFSDLSPKRTTRRAVVYGKWKYIVTHPPDTEELYDLDADPRETTNLRDREPAALAQLRARLAEFDRTAKIYPREFEEAAPVTPEHAEELRALGYVQ